MSQFPCGAVTHLQPLSSASQRSSSAVSASWLLSLLESGAQRETHGFLFVRAEVPKGHAFPAETGSPGLDRRVVRWAGGGQAFLSVFRSDATRSAVVRSLGFLLVDRLLAMKQKN